MMEEREVVPPSMASPRLKSLEVMKVPMAATLASAKPPLMACRPGSSSGFEFKRPL